MMCTPVAPCVDHDPALPGDHLRRGHVRHHEVSVHVHAQLPCEPDVLDSYVRFGAMGRDPDQVSAEVSCALQMPLGADARLKGHRQARALDRPPRGCQELIVRMQRPHVLDR
jgi:hypothetical protein